MNNYPKYFSSEKRILLLIILLIICLIFCIIAYSFSYSALVNENNSISSITTSSSSEDADIINNDNISSDIITTMDTTKITTTNYTTRITTKDNVGIKEDSKIEYYYYNWTADDKRDFTGRNCLFLYDTNGKIVDGYVYILYYNKYEKMQYVSDNIKNCFLEDKYSTEILAIVKDDKYYIQ